MKSSSQSAMQCKLVRAAAGLFTAKVAALTVGAMKAIIMLRFNSVRAVVLVFGLTVGGATIPVAQAEPPQPPTEPQNRARSPQTDERLIGTWTVTFENGVHEWCRVGKNCTAKVVELQRRSAGNVELRDGAVLIVYDDDRLERWTPVGDGAVVEHWFPASNYPQQKPVKGIAERTTATELPLLPLHFVEKPDMKPVLDNVRLPYQVDGEPSAELIYVVSKAFISDSRNPGKIRFRELIDPRYLQKHGLTDRDLAYEIGDNTGLHNYHLADDLRTILFQVDAKGGGRELIIARWVLHEGHLYLSPADPDPETGIFKLWILRTKVN